MFLKPTLVGRQVLYTADGGLTWTPIDITEFVPSAPFDLTIYDIQVTSWFKRLE